MSTFKGKASRTIWFGTTTGHAFDLVKGDTSEFPEICRTDLILNGVIPLDEDEVPTPDPSRQERLESAVHEVLAADDARKIGPDGYPRATAVSKVAGFAVTAEEIAAVCKALPKDPLPEFTEDGQVGEDPSA